MITVGERLRRERIRQGIDLGQLSKDTRINLKYLEAIEAGDPSQIPGGFFYRSFVRQYALALGIEAGDLEGELVRAKEAEAPILNAALEAAPFAAKEADPIIAATNRKIASGRMWAYMLLLIGVVTGCASFYSWWHRAATPASVTAEFQAPAIPQRAAAPSSPVKNVSQNSATPSADAPNNPQPSAQLPAPTADDRVVLAVAAREKTWVTIRADGKTIFSGMLEPSETKILGSKVTTFIKVGNAGGIEITWNGKSIGTLGERGQVKSVLFTPENYQVQPPAAGGSL